jgi:hypothetical protein
MGPNARKSVFKAGDTADNKGVRGDNEGGQSMYNVGNCLECEFGAGDEPGPFTGNREAPNRYVDPVL